MKKLKTPTKDYLQLPFELYYSGPLSYTSWELMSDGPVSEPADIKGLRIEQGRAYGVSFYCEHNTGAELYCCMTGANEGAMPNWLVMSDMDDLNINHAEQHGLTVSSTQLTLCHPGDLDFDYLESIGQHLSDYRLEDEDPDYIILDADGERIKVNCEGYLIDEDDEVNDNIRIVNLDMLDEDESLAQLVTTSDYEAQDAWIKKVWTEVFPEQAPVTFVR